ncbi:hypothetical protein PMAYCL1PPCAC_31321, partial [Pristionchus mayeri]
QGLQTSDRPEIRLAVFAVVLTTSHMVKSTLQIIWFFALLMDKKELQTTISTWLILPNALSAFSEPILLLFTSPKLRKEVFQWRR